MRDRAAANWQREAGIWKARFDEAEAQRDAALAAVQRVREVCANPPVPSRMLIPFVLDALGGVAGDGHDHDDQED